MEISGPLTSEPMLPRGQQIDPAAWELLAAGRAGRHSQSEVGPVTVNR